MTPHDAIEARHKAVKKSRTFRAIREAYGLAEKRVLDIGCGFGEYFALCGEGSAGITTTREEVEYGKQSGLNIIFGNAEALGELPLPRESFDVIWANNLFEHLLSPHEFLMSLRDYVQPDAILILGVPMVPREPSLMNLRRFRGALAGNHINFFTRETLTLTTERAGWKVETIRPFFAPAFLDSLIAPYAPHLYLVAKKDASFAYPEKKLKEWRDDPRYAHLIKAGT